MNDNELPNEKERAPSPTVPPLKTLEDMLYNRILQKKQEIHKNQSMVNTERLWTEIQTLQWVLSESLSIRRQQMRYYY
jgi:hypothetical protein